MVSVNVTTLSAVLVTAAITAAITSMTTTAIIGARSGKETRTGIIKDTDRVGNPGGTAGSVWIQEMPRQDCGPDEVGVWLPMTRLTAEWRCIAKDAIK